MLGLLLIFCQATARAPMPGRAESALTERERRSILRSPPTTMLSSVTMWREMNGTRMPAIIYGTAYKRHNTAALVERALSSGFVGIDTATAEGKRYNDSGVGEALRRVFSSTPRSEYYVQLKLHHVRPDRTLQESASRGAKDATARRVSRSFEHGLANLNLEYVDALLLRGPSPEAVQTGKLSDDDIAAWQTMDSIVRSGAAKQLGVCNFPHRLIDQLRALGGSPPRVLQTKCHAQTAWGRHMREYCARNGMAFQAVSLVTSNRPALERGSAVHQISIFKRATVQKVLLRFALQIGIFPVVGASSIHHIRDDLDAFELELAAREIALIERGSITDNSKLARALASNRSQRYTKNIAHEERTSSAGRVRPGNPRRHD